MFLLTKKAIIKVLAATLAVALSANTIIKKNIKSYSIEPITLPSLGNPPANRVICNSQNSDSIRQHDIDMHNNTCIKLSDIPEFKGQDNTLDEYSFFHNKIICAKNQDDIDCSLEFMDTPMYNTETNTFYDFIDEPLDDNFTREMDVYKFLNNVDPNTLENPNTIENFLENSLGISCNICADNTKNTTNNNNNNDFEISEKDTQLIENNSNTSSPDKQINEQLDSAILRTYNLFKLRVLKAGNTSIINDIIDDTIVEVCAVYKTMVFKTQIKQITSKIFNELKKSSAFDPVNNINDFICLITKIQKEIEILVHEAPATKDNSNAPSNVQEQKQYNNGIKQLHKFAIKKQSNFDNIINIYIFSTFKDAINNTKDINEKILNMTFNDFKRKYSTDIKTLKDTVAKSLDKNLSFRHFSNIAQFEELLIEIPKQMNEIPDIFKLNILEELSNVKNNKKEPSIEYKFIDPEANYTDPYSEKMLQDSMDNSIKNHLNAKKIICKQLYTLFNYDINIKLIGEEDCRHFTNQLFATLNQSFNNQLHKDNKDFPTFIKKISSFINNNFYSIKLYMVNKNDDISKSLNNKLLAQLHLLTNNTNTTIDNKTPNYTALYNQFLTNKQFNLEKIITLQIQEQYTKYVKTTSSKSHLNSAEDSLKALMYIDSHSKDFAERFLPYTNLDPNIFSTSQVTLEQFANAMKQIRKWVIENFNDVIAPAIDESRCCSFISDDIDRLCQSSLSLNSRKKSIIEFYKALQGGKYKPADIVYLRLYKTFKSHEKWASLDRMTMKQLAVYISTFLDNKTSSKPHSKGKQTLKRYLQSIDAFINNYFSNPALISINNKQNNIHEPIHSVTEITSLVPCTYKKEILDIIVKIMESNHFTTKIPNQALSILFQYLLITDGFKFLESNNLPSDHTLVVNNLTSFMNTSAKQYFTSLLELYKYINK